MEVNFLVERLLGDRRDPSANMSLYMLLANNCKGKHKFTIEGSSSRYHLNQMAKFSISSGGII